VGADVAGAGFDDTDVGEEDPHPTSTSSATRPADQRATLFKIPSAPLEATDRVSKLALEP
jgi:hypothetical protein